MRGTEAVLYSYDVVKVEDKDNVGVSKKSRENSTNIFEFV